ncbi:unnamed protein product [Linum tenue]|uniref:Peptide-methionine (R)-S-oxide reductase n=1 Tax=Linum tenue TaxID=586396 RepID=A0AAV0JHH2_9ROSI|nr:unnamed protein product [Linum tenue]
MKSMAALGYSTTIQLSAAAASTRVRLHSSILRFSFNSSVSLKDSSRRCRFPGRRSVASDSPVRAMGSSASSPKPEDVQDTQKAVPSSDEEWKKKLTPEQFYVTRQKGTEGFHREYYNTKTPGTYHCICCDTPLFDGTGWPSYYQPIGNNVKSKLDLSMIFMPRTEVLCAVCDAHLGHVFGDGPPPTGQRYCINRYVKSKCRTSVPPL